MTPAQIAFRRALMLRAVELIKGLATAGQAVPSSEMMAHELSCAPDTLTRVLRQAQAEGLIVLEARTGRSRIYSAPDGSWTTAAVRVKPEGKGRPVPGCYQAALAFLATCHGKPCPTDAEIGEAIGLDRVRTSGRIDRAVREGAIRREGNGRGDRRISAADGSWATGWSGARGKAFRAVLRAEAAKAGLVGLEDNRPRTEIDKAIKAHAQRVERAAPMTRAQEEALIAEHIARRGVTRLHPGFAAAVNNGAGL